MPITHMPGGSTIITGDSIDYFQLCILKTALHAEAKGMRLTRIRVPIKAWCARLGVTPATRAALTAAVEKKIEELKPQQEHIVEEGGRQVRTVGGVEVQ